MSNVLAVLFALASALTIAWGTVVRHRIAEEAPDASGELRDSPILRVIRRPLWWAGLSTAFLGYGFQVVALGFGPLLIVQPILCLSLMFTLPLSSIYQKQKISKAELFWAFALSAAVAIIVIVGNPAHGDVQPTLRRWIPALLIGGAVLIALDRFAYTRIRHEKAFFLGVVTGAIFGYVAVLSKATVNLFMTGGIDALIFNWEGYALIGMATLGTIVQQSSFNAAALKHSLPAMTVAEPFVAFALGYAVLNERFQVAGFEWLLMVLAAAAMVVSTFALSRQSLN
ncbi:DMT family transporter [Corynebacterium glucuronolyticum]